MTKSISLSYKEGGSDKVYNAQILSVGDGEFTVNFAYGRRGNALTTGTKTNAPVDSLTATKIFDKLVKEKVTKGYKIDGSDELSRIAISDKVDTGIYPQLLNAIEEDYARKLILDSDYMVQEKHDGRRMLVEKKDQTIRCINRKGQEIPVPDYVRNSVQNHPESFLIDGEDMGDHFVAFDILSFMDFGITGSPAGERFLVLQQNFIETVGLRVTKAIIGVEEKKRFIKKLMDEKKEGIVFKNINAHYTPGRPNSGGSQLKFKFYATASFIVLKVNTQRSILLGLYQSEFMDIMQAVAQAGNCTIPVNHEVPKEGDVVEVKYLYAFKESGSVYQPSYLGKRDDVEAIECTTAQLKFKPESKEN